MPMEGTVLYSSLNRAQKYWAEEVPKVPKYFGCDVYDFVKSQIKLFVAIHPKLASATEPLFSLRNVDILVLNSVKDSVI